MNHTGARIRHHSCEKHSHKTQGCIKLNAEELLCRLSRARDAGLDAKIILVDTREGRLYHTGHIITAMSMSCYTKTMARRALVMWDSLYSSEQSCPSPLVLGENVFCTQIYQVARSAAPDIVIYDAIGECPFCFDSASVGYFLDGLLLRGNRVYFLTGGFKAFQGLSSSEFIEANDAVNTLPDFQDLSSSDITLSPSSRAPHVLLIPLSCKTLPNFDICKTSVSSPESSPHEICSDFASKQPQRLVFKCVLQKGHHLLNIQEMFSQRGSRIVSPAHGIQKVCKSTATSLSGADDILGAPVSQILPYLYIGNARDAADKELLSRLGITHIISMGVSDPTPLIEDNSLYEYLTFPLADTTEANLRPSLDRAVEFIYNAEKSNGIVLVHCLAGVSRSVAIVMAYLMHKYRNFTVLRALDFVQSRRPIAGPNLHFINQLELFYDELHNQSCQSPTTNSPHHHSRKSSFVEFGEEFNPTDFTVS